MSIRIVFIHGFGYSPTMFAPLAQRIEVDHQYDIDFGFFGPSRSEVPICSMPTVVIGHSLGVLRYLATTPFPTDGLVSLAGFSRFCTTDDFPHGVTPILVKRMQKKLARNARALLTEFYTLCGDNITLLSDDSVPNVAALSAALDDLLHLDARSTPLPQTLALAGRADAVTPLAMQEAIFRNRPDVTFHVHDTAPHTLPLTHPDWCAHHINAFIRRFM
ncbi:alpha/beta fold hydrolase [Desulfovibrio inopinatus]|uniref:alpha/beta fold hydrolase n=1 Tax=Desulfovibrio inopinatus TaxID=102109 RepID=UPI0004805307|nr:alpha/beta hydrolase [Desulfovibrio inopinatus]